MIVVTGGAGFIGSNIVRALNGAGVVDIVVVDVVDVADKARNLASLQIADLVGPQEFLRSARSGAWNIESIVHHGAISSTLREGPEVMATNFGFSKEVFELAQLASAPMVYASSAAVYGAASGTEPRAEQAIGLYGYSKQLFDQWVRRRLGEVSARVVGLRYFNVYGPGEDHKGAMASMVTQMDDCLERGEPIRLFGASCGCHAGEHRRDFVSVADVARVAIWALDRSGASGVVDCGSGRARSFNELASAVIAFRGKGRIEYVEMPAELVDRYQAYTCADLTDLRSLGYDRPFDPIEIGVPAYLSARRREGT